MLFFSKYLNTRQNAEICIDNIFTVFGGVVLGKSLSILMDTRWFNSQKPRTINNFILLFRVLAFMFRLLFPMFFFRFAYIKFAHQ
jgi:hypothetical protein